MESTTTTTERKAAPPYIPYSMLTGLIERMEKDGAIPSQIDKSYLTNIPWGSQNHLLAAVKWLGLTEDGRPTQRLHDLVEHPAERPALWQNILRERYAGPMGLVKNATPQQLEAEFKNYGLSANVQRKAIAFYLAAAKAAGVELSPLFKSKPRASNGVRRTRPRTTGKHQVEQQEHAEHKPRSDHAPELIRNLLKQLPPEGSQWEKTKAKVWLTIAENTFDLVYEWTDTGSRCRRSRSTQKLGPDNGEAGPSPDGRAEP